MWQLPKMDPSNILKYLRKSRTDDPMLTVEEVLSKHEQMLDEWVQRNFPGAEAIPESNCFREVVSGETIESRPKVQELLRQIESPAYKAVLIVEPQRLSRGDLEDIGRIVKLLRYTNTIVITLQYTYDLTDERDRDLFERELKRGNEFLEYQKRIMNNGRLLSVQNGNFIGQTPPYGYKKVTLKDGKRKYHTLEPDLNTAPFVKLIFQMYAQGESAHQIAKKLNAMGTPSSSGKSWTAASVKPIISNDHYIGMVHWNRRKTLKLVEGGEVIASRPRNHDYLVYPGKHEAIIEQELWDAAQAVAGTHLPIKDKARYANPFAGLVRCSCGAPMSRRQYIKNGIEKSAPRLLCDNQVQCGNASCSLSEFTDAVIRAMEAAVADFDLILNKPKEDPERFHTQLIDRLEKHLDELERKELSMWDKYTQENMPKNIFDKLQAKLLADRAATKQQLDNLRTEVSQESSYVKKKETFLSAIATLKDENASVRDQNTLLKQCINSITYARKRKDLSNRRFGTPEPMQLDFDFKI